MTLLSGNTRNRRLDGNGKQNDALAGAGRGPGMGSERSWPGVPAQGGEEVLEIDGGDGCTNYPVDEFNITRLYTSKRVKMVNFALRILYHKKRTFRNITDDEQSLALIFVEAKFRGLVSGRPCPQLGTASAKLGDLG